MAEGFRSFTGADAFGFPINLQTGGIGLPRSNVGVIRESGTTRVWTMSTPVLLSYAFRPFFLLSAGFAVVAVGAWLALLHGLHWPGMAGATVSWHIHEMLFGFVGAAIAGFLLTAISNWTGRPPAQGLVLGTLVAAWTGGRIAMAFAGAIPIGMVVALELAFPLILVGVVAWELVAARNRGNYFLAVFIALFPAVDAGYLLGELGVVNQAFSRALYLAPHLVIVLITIIGGRVIPAFSTNWLRAQGVKRLPQVRPWLDRAALFMVLAVGVADVMAPAALFTGVLAFVAALVHGIRLSNWCGWQTRRESLLVILHLGYAWLVIGYGLLGASSFLDVVPRSSAFHAITVGAMGTLVLAMMSRVSLGHTGRRLHAGLTTVAAYAMVTVAAVLRIVAPMAAGAYLILIDLSALVWMAAFVVFLWEYAPILTRPRLDAG